jgi:soluble lytic murein transglycosylase
MLTLCLLSAALAQEGWTQLAPTAFTTVVPLPDAVRKALADRDHGRAADLLIGLDASSIPGAYAGDVAFLTAWSLQRANRGVEAVKYVDAAAHAETAPPAYVQLVIGETLLDAEKPVEAAEALAQVLGSGPIEVRARLALAEAWQRAGRTADARGVYEALIARPDPSPGSSTALWALAQKVGTTSDAGQAFLRRVYRGYPGSSEDRAAAALMPKPTLEDLAVRGDVLQERGDWAGAVALLGPRLAEVGVKDAVGCRYRYAYGRAQHKLNNLSTAVEVLGPIGRACPKVDDERGAKALYLAGKSLERKKDWPGAATEYALIPKLYPAHTFADDGYALGGIARQEAGDLEGARALWAAGYEAYPTGDLAGENAWRLAWGAFLAGDTTEAVRWADRAVAEVPLATDPTDVLAAAYWGARWRAWPSLTDPRRRSDDPAALAEAATRFQTLCTRDGWSYYAVLGAARLAQLDPARAATLTRPTFDAADAPWQVPTRFLATSAVRNAQGLVRVGLLRDALVELGTLDEDTLGGSEMAIVTGIQTAAGDFLFAHDRLRNWLKTHPPETLGPNAARVLRQAYPQEWWPEVQEAARGYGWDPRVFHALVREESNFNPEIKSHAGACGLSQLMPGTASGCAKRMGLSFRSTDIWKPETNLKIGAWYLDTLHTRYAGNSALALAAYNAGEGNADRWLAAHPEWPTDAVVESIPFRETRFYVKRVLTTWQTYRWLYGDGPLFDDWTRFADDAVP